MRKKRIICGNRIVRERMPERIRPVRDAVDERDLLPCFDNTELGELEKEKNDFD
jgi:hypothetical protein